VSRAEGRPRKGHSDQDRSLAQPSELTPEEQHQLSRVEKVLLSRLEVRMESLEWFSGPLPAPSILAGFEEVLPGSADRIVSMAEEQASHRRNLEAAVITANVRSQQLGQWFGFLLGLAGVVAGTYLVATGRSPEGMTTFLVAVGGLVGVSVYAKSGQQRELARKRPAFDAPAKGGPPTIDGQR
jgi:uncharacterized membrane protein